MSEVSSQHLIPSRLKVRLPILLYHHVGPPRPAFVPRLTISPAAFERQIRWLAERGYSSIVASDWVSWRVEGRPLPPCPIMISFDDAFAGVAEHAFPILKRYRMRASVFVSTALLGGTLAMRAGNNDHPEHSFRGPDAADSAPIGWDVLPLMTVRQVLEWSGEGFEFGSHGKAHADLRSLSESQLKDEVEGSRDDLEQIVGRRVASFSFPYGQYDERSGKAVRSAYDIAFTTDEDINDCSTDLFGMKRTAVRGTDRRLHLLFQVTTGHRPLGHMKRALSRWPMLRERLRDARRAVGGG